MTTAAVRVHADEGAMRDDDPAAKPTRRRFSATHKLAILDEYERLTDSGAKGMWRNEYNQIRPHSSLGYRPPARRCSPAHLCPDRKL